MTYHFLLPLKTDFLQHDNVKYDRRNTKNKIRWANESAQLLFWILSMNFSLQWHKAIFQLVNRGGAINLTLNIFPFVIHFNQKIENKFNVPTTKLKIINRKTGKLTVCLYHDQTNCNTISFHFGEWLFELEIKTQLLIKWHWKLSKKQKRKQCNQDSGFIVCFQMRQTANWFTMTKCACLLSATSNQYNHYDFN